jgi:hypothetical protein
VIEFYQTRTTTKMTIAAERLAVIAAVTLPIAALSSVMGMNVIVNESTQISLLAVMVAMSAAPLVWARRKAGGERPTPGLRDPVLTDGVRSAGDRMMPVSPARL